MQGEAATCRDNRSTGDRRTGEGQTKRTDRQNDRQNNRQTNIQKINPAKYRQPDQRRNTSLGGRLVLHLFNNTINY